MNVQEQLATQWRRLVDECIAQSDPKVAASVAGLDRAKRTIELLDDRPALADFLGNRTGYAASVEQAHEELTNALLGAAMIAKVAIREYAKAAGDDPEIVREAMLRMMLSTARGGDGS